ncbi:hypothetical protein A9Q75_16650 [Colwellia psychrerythraea]|uniref:Ice-binding protein C-terminal domain-containing protein n=1 Tax=Colwellia psychrerythraea TaxID=28229 RepID=A0A1Y5DZX8_COLPS|nr:hypothetical protein A9Q75_16650 [Colwellia psychrerythraea]
MKLKLLKILLPLTFCFGLITNAQANLITNYNPEDVNSSVISNDIQNWFTVDVSDELDSFILSFDWKDQGFGNRKGKLFYSIAGINWTDLGLLAEHNLTSHSVLVNRSELDFFNTPTTLDFGFVVGGGGGHSLSVSNVALTVTNTNVPEPSTLAIFAFAMIGLASRKFKKQS